jgi:hypothetical protein
VSNTELTVVTLAALAAHIAALTAALLLRRGTGALLPVNLVVACVLLGFVASHPRYFQDPVDWQVAGMAAFELFAIAAAVAARWHVWFAAPISCIVFGVHFLSSAGAVAFALTFKMTRLF